MSRSFNYPRPFYHLLCVAFLFWTPARAGPALNVGDASGVAGSTVIVPNYFTTDTNIVALQYDLIYDPSILTAGPSVGADALANHLLDSSSFGPGIRRVLVYSLTNARLTNGVLADHILFIATGAPDATTSITLTNAIFSNAQGAKVEPEGLLGGSLLIVSLATPARLGSLLLSTNGHVQFEVTGAENRRYLIQASTNLIQWTDLSTIVAAAGAVELTDSTATNSSYRFYRAVLVP